MEDKYICCICGKEHTGFGNNPWPVKNSEGKDFGPNDRCCDECNRNIVIVERLNTYCKITPNKKNEG
jgi:hypothetical protein